MVARRATRRQRESAREPPDGDQGHSVAGDDHPKANQPPQAPGAQRRDPTLRDRDEGDGRGWSGVSRLFPGHSSRSFTVHTCVAHHSQDDALYSCLPQRRSLRPRAVACETPTYSEILRCKRYEWARVACTWGYKPFSAYVSERIFCVGAE